MKVAQAVSLFRKFHGGISHSHLVIEASIEGVEEVVVGALLAVGVYDAVQVGEVAVQVHVVGVLATQQKVLATLII